METQTWRHRRRKQTYGHGRAGEGEGGMNGESSKETYSLAHVKASLSVGFFRQEYWSSWASLVARLVKNLPAMQETWVTFLGWEDHLEKEMATHCSILAWRIPWKGILAGYSLWGRKSWI